MEEKKEEKYIPGNYKSSKNIKVIKEITHADKKNSDGTIARTFGTWTAPNNFYYFNENTVTVLNEKDLKNPTLKQLIDNGTIFRVL